MFESFVNSERCKTVQENYALLDEFESFVNSERCKTLQEVCWKQIGLRALLIRKDVKHGISLNTVKSCLRALLIRKDVKRIRM